MLLRQPDTGTPEESPALRATIPGEFTGPFLVLQSQLLARPARKRRLGICLHHALCPLLLPQPPCTPMAGWGTSVLEHELWGAPEILAAPPSACRPPPQPAGLPRQSRRERGDSRDSGEGEEQDGGDQQRLSAIVGQEPSPTLGAGLPRARRRQGLDPAREATDPQAHLWPLRTLAFKDPFGPGYSHGG